MRRPVFTLALSVALVAGAMTASARAQTAAPGRTLDLSFADGRVTLIANGVTLTEILAEWQRKGGSKIVNGDRLAGGPLTYEFRNVPETAVMASLLRNAAGVIVAPRRPGGPTGASLIEQVLVLPTSRPTTGAASLVSMPTNQNPNPVPIVGQPSDDIPPATQISNTPPRGPGSAPPPPQPGPGVVVAPVKPGTPVPAGTIIK